MSESDFVYFVPRELSLGEVAQDAPADNSVCLESIPSSPLVQQAGVEQVCVEEVQVGGSETTETIEEESESVPNPVLPATNEIFWSAIFFLILWALMKYLLLPPIRKLQAQRAQRLQDDRDAAQKAEEDLAKAQADYDAAIQAAREEAGVLLDEARSRASDRRAELVGAAVADVSEARAAATQEMSDARSEAVDNLRGQIRELAVDAAANVLGNRPAETAVVDQTIDELLNEANQTARETDRETGGSSQ